jgi:catechol 2,3-dioxygenase-like lactoylglutathione lyase family enzyme
MAPSFRDEGWDKVAIGRFFTRFGKRGHSIAWYNETRDDLVELYRQLKDNDVRIYAGTGVRSEGEPPAGAIFTHPRDTYTQLEFVTVAPQLGDPRFHGSFNPRWWTTDHPLHIMSSSRITLAVQDMAQARDVYVKVLGGTLLCETDMALTKTRSAFVAVGEDLIVELAEPLDSSSAIATDMEQHHQSLYAVSFRVRDLEAAARYLQTKGIKPRDRDSSTLFTDPATTHGAVYGFTTWDVPDDPRRPW